MEYSIYNKLLLNIANIYQENSLLKNNCYKLNYLLSLINKFLNKVLHEREKVQFRTDVRKKPKAFASFVRDHRA